MAPTQNYPSDPHPSDEEHYDREKRPGGAHPPDDRHAGVEVYAHDGAPARSPQAPPRGPSPRQPSRPDAGGVRTVMWVFMVALVLVLLGLFVTMSGIVPGDDGREPASDAPTIAPQSQPRP